MCIKVHTKQKKHKNTHKTRIIKYTTNNGNTMVIQWPNKTINRVKSPSSNLEMNVIQSDPINKILLHEYCPITVQINNDGEIRQNPTLKIVCDSQGLLTVLTLKHDTHTAKALFHFFCFCIFFFFCFDFCMF